MKKKLNLFTVLFAVAISIIFNYSESVSSFKEGFMDAWNTGEKNRAGEKVETCLLALTPAVKFSKPSSLFNLKSGETMPASFRTVIVDLTTAKKSGWLIVWGYCYAVLFLAGMMMCIVYFFKIIRAVNRSVIFEWINVRRLRRMGFCFIFLFTLNTIHDFCNNYFISKSIELADYHLKRTPIEGGVLLWGVIAFLIAEIFAVGLRLREEQELTI